MTMTTTMRRTRPVALGLVLVSVLLAGCRVDQQTRERVLTGTAVGAAGGAVVGALGSGTLMGGLAIGAAAGAAGSFVGDQVEKALRD